MTNKPHFDIKEKGQCKCLERELFEQKRDISLLFIRDGQGELFMAFSRQEKCHIFLGEHNSVKRYYKVLQKL